MVLKYMPNRESLHGDFDDDMHLEDLNAVILEPKTIFICFRVDAYFQIFFLLQND